MSHTLCAICKNDISDTSSPCPTKFWMTTDRNLEGAEVYRGDLPSIIESIYLEEKLLKLIEIWACRECGSIGIYLGKEFHWFQPKEPAEFRLLEAIKERT